MYNKKVSMKNIAQELGVSVALVSYVLNGKFINRINIHTADRIRTLAIKYNYTPNQIAQSLKTNKTYTLGLIVADISNIFSSELAQYIEMEAHNQGYNVIFASAYEDAMRFKSIVEVFVAKQLDGLILAVPAEADVYLDIVERSGIPYVIMDREFTSIDPHKFINIDNYAASAEVVTHLFESGFKRPAAITLQSSLKHLNDRNLGFVESVNKRYNSEFFLYEIPEKRLIDSIEQIIMHAIEQDKVDVLYFLTNRIAMAGLAVLSKNNIEVPDQVGVVCFDQADAYTVFKTPLTYVKQPIAEMSKEAVTQILNPNYVKNKNKFSTQLVIQKSTLLNYSY